jgi:hypothetical protein
MNGTKDPRPGLALVFCLAGGIFSGLAGSGCAVAADEPLGEAQEAADTLGSPGPSTLLGLLPGALPSGSVTREALTANSLTPSALLDNVLTGTVATVGAFTDNPLTAESLTSNALTALALWVDSNARLLLQYVTGCALPAGAQFELVLGGETYTYDGQLGLAPAWGQAGGRCDGTCQAWVSACVLSRVNYLGQTVPLSVRGGVAPLASSAAERLEYPDREATYYGNVFVIPQVRHACLPPGATSDVRVCGPSLLGCVVGFVGSCDAACDPVAVDGSYPDCRDHVRSGSSQFPAGTTAFPGSITVFLQ